MSSYLVCFLLDMSESVLESTVKLGLVNIVGNLEEWWITEEVINDGILTVKRKKVSDEEHFIRSVEL